ncbi:MAG TPA: hypothetical protein VJA16_23705 [Thermoanaerobaculia bacterium]
MAVRPRAWLTLALAPALLLAAAAAPSVAQAPPPPSGQFQAHQVDERNGIPIIQLTGSYDTALGGQPNAEPRAVVAQELYRTHPDDFDFLVVIPNFAFQSSDGVAFHWQVRSSVLGIGQAPYDFGSAYGSPARLQGFIDLQALSQMQTDPLQPDFEATLNAFAHELMHQWGVYVHLKNPDGTLSTELLGLAQAHWSFLVDTRASVMYGNQWQDNGGGTFSSVAVRRFYSPLDLYLAGFYDASEVPPFLVITSPGTDPAALPQLGATVTGTGRMVSVDDIIAADGPRVPAAAQAQHAFKAVFVFLVRPGDVVTDDQLAAIDQVRREAMTHFSVLTGGRGTLDIATEPLPPAPGSPPPVQGGRCARPRPALATLSPGCAAGRRWTAPGRTRRRPSRATRPWSSRPWPRSIRCSRLPGSSWRSPGWERRRATTPTTWPGWQPLSTACPCAPACWRRPTPTAAGASARATAATPWTLPWRPWRWPASLTRRPRRSPPRAVS